MAKRTQSKLDIEEQEAEKAPADPQGDNKESGVEYGKQPFPPKCPICGVDCKSYATRGPVTYYRCENEECDRYLTFTVKQSRPWRNTMGSPQMDVGVR